MRRCDVVLIKESFAALGHCCRLWRRHISNDQGSGGFPGRLVSLASALRRRAAYDRVDRADAAIFIMMEFGDLDVAKAGLARQLCVGIEKPPAAIPFSDRMMRGPAFHRLKNAALIGEGAIG